MQDSLCQRLVRLVCWYSTTQPVASQIPASVKQFRNLSYVENGRPRQQLDLYVPSGNRPRPLVIWIHGGGWAKGSKDRIGQCQWVLQEGFALASIGYRLTDEAIFPAQLDDCRAAIRWLVERHEAYQLNPDQFHVWGASAGGHLAAMVALSRDPKTDYRVRSAINWFGPADLLTMQQQRILATRLNADAPDSFESRLVGRPIQTVPALTRAASPTSHVSADDPPMLIMHGDQDALVPLAQSQMLYRRLQATGISSQLIVLTGAGHGGRAFQTESNRQLILDFLNHQQR